MKRRTELSAADEALRAGRVHREAEDRLLRQSREAGEREVVAFLVVFVVLVVFLVVGMLLASVAPRRSCLPAAVVPALGARASAASPLLDTSTRASDDNFRGEPGGAL